MINEKNTLASISRELTPLVVAETPKLLEKHHDLVDYLGKKAIYRSLMKKFPPIIAASEALVGIEVEVEGVKNTMVAKVPAGWMATQDGSLRNHGKEFVSDPLQPEAIKSALTTLFIAMRFGQRSSVNFSWRTSIHVHLNVRNLTVEQIANIFLVYSIFEDEFFEFVGPDRRQTNFCVPWCETSASSILSDFFLGKINLKDLTALWQKYSALNLRNLTGLPVGDFPPDEVKKSRKGTLEFRHLGGTKEPSKILHWINLILSLYNFAKSNSLDHTIKALETIHLPEKYKEFKKAVFGEVHTLLTGNPSVSCIGAAKSCLFPADFDIPSRGLGLTKMVAKRAKKGLELPAKKVIRAPGLIYNTAGLGLTLDQFADQTFVVNYSSEEGEF